MKISRRSFIVSAALLPVACGSPLSYERGTSIAQPNPIPPVRSPQLGQEWVYVKKNLFDGRTVGIIKERINSIGSNINIARLENDVPLPSEIQSSWGVVIVDPQWPQLLSFSPGLPLWPLELTSSWSRQFITKYSIGGISDNKLNWQEYMSSNGWEVITVPAGQFTTLKYQTLINYESEDPNKVNCIRKETIWFAPSIGRWVARESSGSYQIQSQIGVAIHENSYQWQLTSFK
jgi:hypothetical protein